MTTTAAPISKPGASRRAFLARYVPTIRAAYPAADEDELTWRAELLARADMRARARSRWRRAAHPDQRES